MPLRSHRLSPGNVACDEVPQSTAQSSTSWDAPYPASRAICGTLVWCLSLAISGAGATCPIDQNLTRSVEALLINRLTRVSKVVARKMNTAFFPPPRQHPFGRCLSLSVPSHSLAGWWMYSTNGVPQKDAEGSRAGRETRETALFSARYLDTHC